MLYASASASAACIVFIGVSLDRRWLYRRAGLDLAHERLDQQVEEGVVAPKLDRQRHGGLPARQTCRPGITLSALREVAPRERNILGRIEPPPPGVARRADDALIVEPPQRPFAAPHLVRRTGYAPSFVFHCHCRIALCH